MLLLLLLSTRYHGSKRRLNLSRGDVTTPVDERPPETPNRCALAPKSLNVARGFVSVPRVDHLTEAVHAEAKLHPAYSLNQKRVIHDTSTSSMHHDGASRSATFPDCCATLAATGDNTTFCFCCYRTINVRAKLPVTMIMASHVVPVPPALDTGRSDVRIIHRSRSRPMRRVAWRQGAITLWSYERSRSGLAMVLAPALLNHLGRARQGPTLLMSRCVRCAVTATHSSSNPRHRTAVVALCGHRDCSGPLEGDNIIVVHSTPIPTPQPLDSVRGFLFGE